MSKQALKANLHHAIDSIEDETLLQKIFEIANQSAIESGELDKSALTEDDLAKLQAYFRNKPVLRAWVFGSFARHEADRLSDLDLLVELDHSQKVGLEYFGMIGDLEEMFSRKVDLVTLKSLNDRIRPYIDQNKKLIYERVRNSIEDKLKSTSPVKMPWLRTG